jgi:hypothetical protein
MSALGRPQQMGTRPTHIPELVRRIWNKSVYLHLFGNALVFCNRQPLNLRLDRERIDSGLRSSTIPSGGSSFSQKKPWGNSDVASCFELVTDKKLSAISD